MGSFRADVEPAVLIWARQSASLTIEQAAQRIDTDPIILRFWEEGAYSEAQPTFSMLCNMADVYNFPLAAFYLDAPPPFPPTSPEAKVPDFRSSVGNRGQRWSPELRANYEWVTFQREIALELAGTLGTPASPLTLSIDQTESSSKAARLIREWLDVGLDEQFSWRDKYQALRGWTVAIESQQVLVSTARGIGTNEMRGYAISEQPFPSIVVNGKDLPQARIFTLIHELTHVLLHNAGICDLAPGNASHPSTPIELYCNDVAGHALVPTNALWEEVRTLGVASPRFWSDEQLSRLANQFWVSRLVILRRLIDIGVGFDDQFYGRLQRSNEYFREEDDERRSPSKGGNYYAQKVADLGRRYIRLVLDAYHEDKINTRDLVEYLDARLDSVPGIARSIGPQS